jgi:hypothetical protein
MDTYGREFDQITPVSQQARYAKQRVASPEPLRSVLSRAERALRAGSGRGGWVMEGFGRLATDAVSAGLVALFRHEGTRERSAILVEPRDLSRKAFARTRDCNVSYLLEWQGTTCRYDDFLIKECVREIAAGEATDP